MRVREQLLWILISSTLVLSWGGGEISLVMSAAVTDVILLSLPPVSYRTAGLGLGTQAGTPAFLCGVWGSNLGHQGGVAHPLTP